VDPRSKTEINCGGAMFIKKFIGQLIINAIKEGQSKGDLPVFEIPTIIIGYSPHELGDYSSPIALSLEKISKHKAMFLAEHIAKYVESNEIFDIPDVAQPGFINFRFKTDWLSSNIGKTLLKINIGNGRKVNVEFISANPTGPLTLGNGRGGFFGDSLSNILQFAGFEVNREYYINDRGTQIDLLGQSIYAKRQILKGIETSLPQDGYQGSYINEIASKFLEDSYNDKKSDYYANQAKEELLVDIKRVIADKMRIQFNTWFSEKSLFPEKIKDLLNDFKEKDIIFEKDGALWFKSSQFGDDQDRVLIKSNGSESYFLSDIAHYLETKKTGYQWYITILGADHHGYAPRLKAALKALDFKPELNFVVMQLVRLFSQGKEVRMSKRTGAFITIEELIDEVGHDVARFMFLMSKPDTHMDFDLDVAKMQSNQNPVFYVQYAYARIAGIIEKSKEFKISDGDFKNLLVHPAEIELMKYIVRFDDVIEEVVTEIAPYKLPYYAIDLVDKFHSFYERVRVLSDDPVLTSARLMLCVSTQQVLAKVLGLIGVSAPERM